MKKTKYDNQFHQDCRFFKGYKPCDIHKKTQIECPECPHYSPWDKKFLIIKQGELGDVLRTTPLVRAIKEKHPNAYIVWLVEEKAKECVLRNSFIDEVVVYHPSVLQRFMIEKYDTVICLDKDIASITVATLTKAKRKLGFGMDENGKVKPFNKEAEYKWAIGISDNMNKENKLTYQKQIFEITGYTPSKDEYIFSLPEVSKVFKEEFIGKHNLQQTQLIIGFNTGVGAKFLPRKWPSNYFIELGKQIDMACSSLGVSYKILLLGGSFEEDRNNYIFDRYSKAGYNKMIHTGTTNSLEEFFGLIDTCHIIVTGDTMGMHVGIALKKKLVVLMGPITTASIDTYNFGPMITSKEHACLGCFRDICDMPYQCMDAIPPSVVLEETKKHINSTLLII